MKEPYFSVCIETYNRGGTIRKALESVQAQSFRDFEVILVDDASTDATVREIKDFFKSDSYLNNPFDYKLEVNKKRLGGVKNWNRPLELAKGRYIAVLEGDDAFRAEHLKRAHEVFETHKVGIYAVGNQKRPRKKQGLMGPEDYFRFIYRVEEVPAPSEAIFIRAKNGKPFYYNVNGYDYCPEVSLYLEIASAGFGAFHGKEQDVIRGRGSNRDKGYTWYYFRDRFKIIDDYKEHKWIGKKDYEGAIELQSQRLFKAYVKARAIDAGDPEGLFKEYTKLVKSLFPMRYYRFRALKAGADAFFSLKGEKLLKKAKRFSKKGGKRI